ncbi:hypothetical protein [Deinococcus radiotolerans]|uniref:Uncharacterized protein n=1 Tax=Deinococcus radiotolerans TaxID=1309407 RepID=A0ABQ2FQZ5_9DEIO|nr:hypothetical protein [Deinococcus radiotolerans]GGL18369.1 hypothetical protein GCM10010844_41510 [Deinococcus radiotolerans]
MALSLTARLEARYGLTAEDFELEGDQYRDRAALWQELAAEREAATEPQRTAHAQALALTALIMAQTRRADKFRAEGDITTERDILGRVAIFQGWLTAAERDAGLAPPDTSPGPRHANPNPTVDPWGLR